MQYNQRSILNLSQYASLKCKTKNLYSNIRSVKDEGNIFLIIKCFLSSSVWRGICYIYTSMHTSLNICDFILLYYYCKVYLQMCNQVKINNIYSRIICLGSQNLHIGIVLDQQSEHILKSSLILRDYIFLEQIYMII